MGKYDKIINLPHHKSKNRQQMSINDRSAQFAPFSALTGYDDIVKETARETDERVELSDSEIEILNQKQNILLSNIDLCPQITVTYFVPDSKKSGGKYVNKTAHLKKIDGYKKLYIFTDNTKVPIREIISITGDLFTDLEK